MYAHSKSGGEENVNIPVNAHATLGLLKLTILQVLPLSRQLCAHKARNCHQGFADTAPSKLFTVISSGRLTR